MKRIVISLAVTVGFLSCNQKKLDSFTIEGSIEGFKDATEVSLIYLTENNGKWEEITINTYLLNSKFHFEGQINELTTGTLVYDAVEIPLYLEPSDIILTIDNSNPYNYEILGLSVESEDIKLRKILADKMTISHNIVDSIQEIFNKIEVYENVPDTVDILIKKAHQWKSELMINSKILDSMRFDFVKKHSTYQIAPNLLYILSKNNLINNDTVEALYNKLTEHSKMTLLGRLALDQINETKLTVNSNEIVIGEIAPNFLRKSMQGVAVNLSDYNNEEYVLLDFWASWCGPCLKETPQVKKLHDTYASKGLRIIGVSSDKNQQDWLNAVEKYEMDGWLHVLSDSDPCDNYFVNTDDIGEMYNVKYIPLFILIDKQGQIIAKWQHINNDVLSFINSLFS